MAKPRKSSRKPSHRENAAEFVASEEDADFDENGEDDGVDEENSCSSESDTVVLRRPSSKDAKCESGQRCDWAPFEDSSFSSESVADSAEEKYMEQVWEESDDDWQPPWMRTAKKQKPKHGEKNSRVLGARRLRRKSEHANTGEDADDLDAEEVVDREDPLQSYNPLDRESFEGHAIPQPSASELAATTHLRDIKDRFENAWGDTSNAPLPGQKGFNAFATKRMRAAKLGEERMFKGVSCPGVQLHQDVVTFLLHPTSPIKRILVDHPTGSGKTREMVLLLDGLFHDPRPKVPIFPKQPVCRNFYTELFRWPSRYRDYYCCVCPGGAFVASRSSNWRALRRNFWELHGLRETQVRELARSMREVLEMKGAFMDGAMRPGSKEAFMSRHPGEAFPGAPLRALGYASAGGFHSRLDGRGRPVSAFLKLFHPINSTNVYDNKIVLLDEAHNLVLAETRYSRQLSNLRERLQSASDCILVGFTGTPVLQEPKDGRKLLDVIKGEAAKRLSDEGFLSSHACKTQPLFPVCKPEGIPDEKLSTKILKQLCHRVALHAESLHSYTLKSLVPELPPQRLRAYCNMCAYAASYHDGRGGCKEYILNKAKSCAPKFHGIATEVERYRKKSLVLVARGSGYRAMLDIMRQAANRAKPKFAVASMEQLAEFNHPDNVRGDRFMCLVADAAQCGEGVSFLSVRAVHLADIPQSPSQFVQQCGRASRMFGHRGLNMEDQVVKVHVWMAEFPVWARDPLGAWALRVYCRRSLKGVDPEPLAEGLLKQLKKIKVKSLEDLKRRVDSVGKKSGHAGLSGDSGRILMKRLGLVDTAHNMEATAGTIDGGRLPLARALQVLLQSSTSALSQQCTQIFTADETAMDRLTQCFGPFVDALKSLRENAVDKEVLGDPNAVAKVAKAAGSLKMPPPQVIVQLPSPMDDIPSGHSNYSVLPMPWTSHRAKEVPSGQHECARSGPPSVFKRPAAAAEISVSEESAGQAETKEESEVSNSESVSAASCGDEEGEEEPSVRKKPAASGLRGRNTRVSGSAKSKTASEESVSASVSGEDEGEDESTVRKKPSAGQAESKVASEASNSESVSATPYGDEEGEEEPAVRKKPASSAVRSIRVTSKSGLHEPNVASKVLKRAAGAVRNAVNLHDKPSVKRARTRTT